MRLFSMNWFKSELKKEREALELEEQKMKVNLLKQQYDKNNVKEEEYSNNIPVRFENCIFDEGSPKIERPYSNIRLVGNILTIVLADGNILTKTNATQHDFQKARIAESEEALLQIAQSIEGLKEKREMEAEIAKYEALSNGISLLEETGEFEVEDDSIYLKGIKRSIPQLLIEEFIQKVDEIGIEHLEEDIEYQALKKFWLKCCLNPNGQSAEDLYGFLSKHQFKIDKHGNFYAYRRVVSKQHVHKELVEFVSNTYNKVKGIWKKKPINYKVWQEDNGSFYFTNKNDNGGGLCKFHGNLEELYLDLPNMQEDSYTSAHTGREDYKIGEVISMPRHEGDDNNHVSCSRGFHASSREYNYSGFGDTPILVIINPIDVLAVPVGELGKLRTCRWFFATILDEEEKYILDDDDFDTTELGDVFEEKCSKNLQEYVQNSIAEEVKRHTFTIPQISASEISNIIYSLEEMKNIISDRIVEFD